MEDNSLTAEQRYWLQYFPVAPTKAELVKYAQKFGPEGVLEIARQYGVDLQKSDL